jgi:hypothetical protein
METGWPYFKSHFAEYCISRIWPSHLSNLGEWFDMSEGIAWKLLEM